MYQRPRLGLHYRGVSMKITKRQLRRIIRESLLLEQKSFSEQKGRWTYEWEWDGSNDSWTLTDDEGLTLTGDELTKQHWPVLNGVGLDDALEKFESANKDHFKFDNGKAGEAFGEVQGTEAWAEIELERPEQEDADALWDAVSSVRKQIVDWGDAA